MSTLHSSPGPTELEAGQPAQLLFNSRKPDLRLVPREAKAEGRGRQGRGTAGRLRTSSCFLRCVCGLMLIGGRQLDWAAILYPLLLQLVLRAVCISQALPLHTEGTNGASAA